MRDECNIAHYKNQEFWVLFDVTEAQLSNIKQVI